MFNEEGMLLKRELIVLSLSPLFFLTLLQYFPFEKMGMVWRYFFDIEMIAKYLPLYIGSWICLIWTIAAIFIFVKFLLFQTYDVTGGYEVQNVVEEKEAGLNFFLTLILPLFVNDISTWNGLVMMICLSSIIVCLLNKTNLYYQNPILVILNYKIYRISFMDNEREKNEEYIAVTRGNIEKGDIIEYKKVKDNVLVVRRR